MILEIINNKAVCSPKTLNDIQRLQAIEHKEIIVDLVENVPHIAIIGCLMEMQRKGKKIVVIYKANFFKDSLVHLKHIQI